MTDMAFVHATADNWPITVEIGARIVAVTPQALSAGPATAVEQALNSIGWEMTGGPHEPHALGYRVPVRQSPAGFLRHLARCGGCQASIRAAVLAALTPDELADHEAGEDSVRIR